MSLMEVSLVVPLALYLPPNRGRRLPESAAQDLPPLVLPLMLSCTRQTDTFKTGSRAVVGRARPTESPRPPATGAGLRLHRGAPQIPVPDGMPGSWIRPSATTHPLAGASAGRQSEVLQAQLAAQLKPSTIRSAQGAMVI
jgi:hypothetical protein